MIVLDRVSKSFAGQTVLSEISLRVPRQLTTVVMGPSGAGKSVLARLVVGLHRPDAGRILLEGLDLGALSERQLLKARRKVGMCFQDGALFNSMSVGENVAFPLRRHTQLAEGEIRRLVASKLEQVGLPGTQCKMPDELSGGMRKRVGIARAIALDPEILILDEPTSGLDPLMAGAIDDLLLEMKHDRTILIISHDVANVMAVADGVAVLLDHRLVACGTVGEILDSPLPAVRQFLGRRSPISMPWPSLLGT